MGDRTKVIETCEAFEAAIADSAVQTIRIRGRISGLKTARLSPGRRIEGEDDHSRLTFNAGSDGLELTADNEIVGISLQVSPESRAILNDTSLQSLGTLRLSQVRAIGQVQILAARKVMSGHVEVEGLDIVIANTTNQNERPHGFGVNVLQGAFTLWNMQPDSSSRVTSRLTGISVGRPNAPTIGSGIFVSGTKDGGCLNVSLLETEAVYTDGGIKEGTPDLISGGVFTVFNAFVDSVVNRGAVTTYGPNDMVLDNWGTVDRWIVKEKLTSYGPSGIGFVNFAAMNELRVESPIETFGQGARGFNVYDGTINYAEFDRITTHGDGAVGVQVSKPIGDLVIHRGIETFGGTGDSLVKGVVTKLSAIAFSVKEGGHVNSLRVTGGITVHGRDISPLEIADALGTFSVDKVSVIRST